MGLSSSILIVLLLAVSCSSKPEGYKSVYLKPKVVLVKDNETNTVYFTTAMEDARQSYLKWKEEGRINRNPEHSCFDSRESVNYIMMVENTIPHLRLYAAGGNFEVIHRTVNSLVDGKFGSISTENKSDSLKVKQQTCVRLVNGLKEIITSEIYY